MCRSRMGGGAATEMPMPVNHLQKQVEQDGQGGSRDAGRRLNQASLAKTDPPGRGRSGWQQRVIVLASGKGGVGKTTFRGGLRRWPGASIRRGQPATSAARIAASRRSTRAGPVDAMAPSSPAADATPRTDRRALSKEQWSPDRKGRPLALKPTFAFVSEVRATLLV